MKSSSADQILWKRPLFGTLIGVRDSAPSLAASGRGSARSLMERAMAAPRRVYLGAGLAALAAGIGGNALLMQMIRHTAALPAPATQDLPTASAAAASPPSGVEPVALQESPTPISAPGAPSAAAPPAASGSPVSAPDTTASIGSAAQDKQRLSPPASLGPDRGERRPAAHAPDPIRALLRGKPVGDGSHLVREAQVALAKLGYPVKPGGAEDGATRRALRRFERAHGLAPTTEISPELVKQLAAAARAGD